MSKKPAEGIKICIYLRDRHEALIQELIRKGEVKTRSEAIMRILDEFFGTQQP